MANLLDEASILLTPTAYDNGSMLAVKPENGDGDISFSRNSAATRVNAQGLVENVQILSSNLVSNGDFSQESSELVTNGDFATDTDWIKNGQVTIGGGVAYFDSDGTFTQIAQSISGVSGKNVKVVIEITEYTQGTLKVLFSGGTQQNLPNSVGVHTLYFNNADSDTINIARLGGVTNLKIDNISVKEVGQDWTLGGTATIGDNLVNINSPSGENAEVYQSSVLVIGRKYKLDCTLNKTSGDTQFVNGGTFILNNGSNVIQFTATDTRVYFKRGAGSVISSISNISLIEITDDTNLPRINYEGFSYDANGDIIPNSGCGSWLLEPQSTNLITYSEDFSDASWGKSATTVSANSTISADGTQNASLIQSTQTGTALVSVSYPTLTVGNTYTFSCFAKKGNNDWIRLAHISSGGTGCWFDLENGVVGTVNSESATIEDYGNGWYKCTNTFIATTSTGANLVFIGICDADGSTNAGIIGQNDYLWGAQLEQQSFATSYIPTQGAASTRLQDIATNSGNASLINSEEGTLYVDYKLVNQFPSFPGIQITDDSLQNQVSFYTYNNSLTYYVKSNNINTVLNTEALSENTDYKLAISYSYLETSLYLNGEKKASYLNKDMPLDLRKIIINVNGNVSKYKALAVYKTALTDASLRSLTYPPAVATTFDLNFNTIAEDFTFTRGSEATFVNAQGLIQSTASNDAPRLDYSTGAKAFLLEPQSTNLVTQSELFSDAVWTKSGTTVTSGFLSPDGTTNAYKITENTANSVHKLQIINGVPNSFQNQSIFVKYDNSQQFIQTTSSRSISNYVNFDISNKTFTNFGTSVGNIIELNNGWLRLDVYHDSSTTVYWHFITSLTSVWSESYLGTEKYLLIWGAQVEAQSYATSYIPTSGASATRNQELCNNATPVINSEEGTLYAEISALSDDLTNRLITISNGTTNNRLILQYNSQSNNISCNMVVGGSARGVISYTTAIGLISLNKIAVRYSSTNFDLYVNGVLRGSVGAGSVMVANTMNELQFANYNGTLPFFGNTKGLKYYPKALADVQLQDLTTL